MIVFSHGIMSQQDKELVLTSDEGDVASLAAVSASSLPLIPWWDGT